MIIPGKEPDFTKIDYLRTGTRKQREIYELLIQNGIMSALKDYTPLLTGTFPLGLDIESSDLDIICYWKDEEKFENTLSRFSFHPHFRIYKRMIKGKLTVIAHFVISNYRFEVFGQNCPVRQQDSFRHMMNEYFILKKSGEAFKEKIIEMKKKGIKTEPAFAQLLGLEGDPFEALLDYPAELPE